ncbi:MAG: hypothetical protein BMS9Abin09_0442 [Gammaproteobacteria bacterium]|nr:MAG: hypothetical protein BMS9Abin09_0442 [Gammaproteobacteria bacterium]
MPREKPVASRRVKEFAYNPQPTSCTNRGRNNCKPAKIGAVMREN